MDRLSKFIAGLSWLVFSALASAQSFYISGEPPANWRPGSNYSDGVARVLVGKFGGGGIHQTGGLSMMIGPLTIREGGWQVLTQAADPYPDDPVRSLLWKLAPGSEAHAFVPAAIYGAGIVSNTVFRFGARQVVSSAFLKFATGAGKDMARQTFRGAAVGTIATVLAGLGLNWVWDQATQQWVKPMDSAVLSDGYTWKVQGVAGDGWHEAPTLEAACALVLPAANTGPGMEGTSRDYVVSLEANPGRCRIYSTYYGYRYPVTQRVVSNCPAGWYVTPAGCLQNPSYQPVEEPDFEQRIKSIPWPDDLPEQLPEGVPVEQPVINPLPSPWDKPKPFFDPIGDPVKNPQYDPQQQPSTQNPPKVQPGREIQGSPTIDDPWRVSVKPVDKPIVNPEDAENEKPTPDPELEPEDPANPEEESPNKPSERVPLLCEVFPDILACSKLDTPEGPELPEKAVEVELVPDGGWGADNAACPSPRHINKFGYDIPIPFDMFCQYMSGLRPVIIAMAWLSAAFILVGGFKQGD